jgi:beta-glucanase (GH16 family)
VAGQDVVLTYRGNPVDSGRRMQLSFFDFSSGLSSTDPRDVFLTLNAQGVASVTYHFTGNTSGASFKFHIVGPSGYSSTVVVATFVAGSVSPTPSLTATPTATPASTPTSTPSSTPTILPSPTPQPTATAPIPPSYVCSGNSSQECGPVTLLGVESAGQVIVLVNNQISPNSEQDVTFTYRGNPADSGKQLELSMFNFSAGLGSNDPRDAFLTLNSQGQASVTVHFTGNSAGKSFMYHIVGPGYTSDVVTATFGGASPTPTGTSTPGGTPQPSDTPTPSFTFTPGPVDTAIPTPLPRPSVTSTGTATARPTPNPYPTPNPSASALLWSDEFSGVSGSGPVSDSWSAVHGTGWPLVGWGNNEDESYEDYANKVDGNGSLVITATRAKGMGTGMSGLQSKWVSGKITTQGHESFLYGKLESRIQVPAGGGTWPAFWMLGDTYPALPWPWSGELDIMEVKGNDPLKLWTSVHGAAGGGATANWPAGNANITTASSAFSAGYHTFGILWEPDLIQWTLDGVVVKSASKANWATVSDAAWPFNQAYFINMNLAMGGDFAGGVDASLTSAQMKVDWVRYSQYKGYGQLITK